MGLYDSPGMRRTITFGTLVGCAFALAACQDKGVAGDLDELTTSVKFDEATYGAPASPRVVSRTAEIVEKGGGRSQIGKPYKIRGKWYYPKDEPGYVASGKASWYGPNFHGRLTANGETYDMNGVSAAHKTFPLPSYAIVTNLENGHSLKVRVNDRGPFSNGREIDLSRKAAELLDFKHEGTADVRVEYVGQAPVEGDDTDMLLASYSRAGDVMTAEASTSGLAAGSATAYAGEGDAPMPGVRPMRSLFQNQPSRTGELIESISSYRSRDGRSGASAVLEALGASGRNGVEEINLGTIDRALMASVGDVIGVGTEARAETTDRPNLVTATVTANPGVDRDALLRRLWAAGFTDAFVVRD